MNPDNDALPEASLDAVQASDPRRVEAFMAHRLLDHDLRRLLDPDADDVAFTRGVLAALDQRRLSTGRFIAKVTTSQLGRQARSKFRVFIAGPLAAAAIFVLAVMGWLFRSDRTPVTLGQADGQHFCVGARFAPDAALTLTFHDGSTVTLDRGTRLTVMQGQDAAGDGAGKLLNMEAGEVLCVVTPQPARQPLIVRSPEAELRVRGTTFTLASRNGCTSLQMRSGEVDLLRRGASAGLAIAAGMRAEVQSGQEPRLLTHVQPRPPFIASFDAHPGSWTVFKEGESQASIISGADVAGATTVFDWRLGGTLKDEGTWSGITQHFAAQDWRDADGLEIRYRADQLPAVDMLWLEWREQRARGVRQGSSDSYVAKLSTTANWITRRLPWSEFKRRIVPSGESVDRSPNLQHAVGVSVGVYGPIPGQGRVEVAWLRLYRAN